MDRPSRVPMQMLKRLAKKGRAAIGGAFLARSGRDVFNTFVLVLPTGESFSHDKDFPTTSMESSLCAGGEDDEFVKEIEKKGVTTEAQPSVRRSRDVLHFSGESQIVDGSGKSGAIRQPSGTRAAPPDALSISSG